MKKAYQYTCEERKLLSIDWMQDLQANPLDTNVSIF